LRQGLCRWRRRHCELHGSGRGHFRHSGPGDSSGSWRRFARLFLPQVLVAKSRLADGARVAAFRANDLGLDDEIVRTADQQQVLNIIAAHNHELPLLVEVESVDYSEPRLACPAITRQLYPAPRSQPEKQRQQDRSGDGGSR
jgi:hypothetical protein